MINPLIITVVGTIAATSGFALGVMCGRIHYQDKVEVLEDQNQRFREYIKKLEEQEGNR